MKNVLRSLAFVIPLLVCCVSASAQNLPGKRVALQSEILKEERIIQVLLPEGYRPGSQEKYDVMYLLDGDSNLQTIAAIQQFIQAHTGMPPVIMVAVFNTDRSRDLSPTRMAGVPSTGGSDKFLAFLKAELVPYINKSYPVSGNAILYGHSLGGLFAMYALLSEPQLFNYYLAVDPSFWWDDNYLNKLAVEKLSAASHAGKLLFVAGRDEAGIKQMGITSMDTLLKEKAPKDFAWKIASYPEEDHGSIRLKSVYDGLRYFYEGYGNQGIPFHPMNGIVLKDKPYKLYYFGPPQEVRYTVDGSEPTSAAPVMGAELTLTNGATFSAKALGRKDRYNKATVGEFKLGTTLAASARPANAKPGGFRYSYYEGEWDELPDFGKLKPVHSGIAGKDFNVNKLPRQTNFATLIEGYIEIQKNGYYIFVLDSDDGSKLFVGDKQLIVYDGLHGDGKPKTYMLPLEKGFYPVRIEYFQKGGGAMLKLDYVVPDEVPPRPVPVPFELQYGSP
jgi:predicted alpha/beta superfamily hydrolase